MNIQAKAIDAVGIEGIHKLGKQGLVVVDAKRLDALERLYGSEKQRWTVMREKPPFPDGWDYDYAPYEEREKANAWADKTHDDFFKHEDEIEQIIDELEAMENGESVE